MRIKMYSILIPFILIAASCGTIAKSMVLDAYKDAGFSSSFITQKRHEIEEQEKKHEEEYKKTNEKPSFDQKYEPAIVLEYENGYVISEAMRSELTRNIMVNVEKNTKLKVNALEGDKSKYRVIIDIGKNQDKIEEINITIFKYERFVRGYTVRSVYIMNNEEKEIPFTNICDIVSGYIIMAIQNSGG
ncbi:MAG: hypothetical protein JXB03_00835 [Spirochaetales bacterium]|nr:hypothetical protein [Spirochaetales bacterium]